MDFDKQRRMAAAVPSFAQAIAEAQARNPASGQVLYPRTHTPRAHKPLRIVRELFENCSKHANKKSQSFVAKIIWPSFYNQAT
jgi:hypothetical protein